MEYINNNPQTDLEKLKVLVLNQYPPTNTHLLKKWEEAATLPILKKYLSEWIKELEGGSLVTPETYDEAMAEIHRENGVPTFAQGGTVGSVREYFESLDLKRLPDSAQVFIKEQLLNPPADFGTDNATFLEVKELLDSLTTEKHEEPVIPAATSEMEVQEAPERTVFVEPVVNEGAELAETIRLAKEAQKKLEVPLYVYKHEDTGHLYFTKDKAEGVEPIETIGYEAPVVEEVELAPAVEPDPVAVIREELANIEPALDFVEGDDRVALEEKITSLKEALKIFAGAETHAKGGKLGKAKIYGRKDTGTPHKIDVFYKDVHGEDHYVHSSTSYKTVADAVNGFKKVLEGDTQTSIADRKRLAEWDAPKHATGGTADEVSEEIKISAGDDDDDALDLIVFGSEEKLNELFSRIKDLAASNKGEDKTSITFKKEQRESISLPNSSKTELIKGLIKYLKAEGLKYEYPLPFKTGGNVAINPQREMDKTAISMIVVNSAKLFELISGKNLPTWAVAKISKAESSVAAIKHTLEAKHPELFEKGGNLEGVKYVKMQLKHIHKYAKQLEAGFDKLEFEAWMSSLLFIAADGLDSVYHYLDYEKNPKLAEGGHPEKWIQKSINPAHKGLLREHAEKEGLIHGKKDKLSLADLHRLEQEGGKTARRAHWAETLKRLRLDSGGNLSLLSEEQKARLDKLFEKHDEKYFGALLEFCNENGINSHAYPLSKNKQELSDAAEKYLKDKWEKLRQAADVGFVATERFENGDVVFDKEHNTKAIVLDNFGDAINGDHGEIRVDQDGTVDIFTYDKYYNRNGYNLVKEKKGSQPEVATGIADDLVLIFNDTDGIFAWPEPMTRAAAEEWIRNTRKAFHDHQGYYLTSSRERISPDDVQYSLEPYEPEEDDDEFDETSRRIMANRKPGEDNI